MSVSVRQVEVIDVASLPRQPLIAARTSHETKMKFAALAASRGMTESALLIRLVETVLELNPPVEVPTDVKRTAPADDRVSLRLRAGDRHWLEARAAARQMKPATYLVALIRAHVRHNPMLPTSELDALKSAVAQLSAVRRCLQGVTLHDPTVPSDQFLACLRDTVQRVDTVHRCTSDLVRSNLISWEAGDA
jgi:hypothetical protein